MKKVLTIAGSDSSGGAGIQADIKTMTVQGVYAMSAITALTAQNTIAIRSIYPVSPDFLKQQINAVFDDIRPDAVKIGMVPSPELAEVIVERLSFYRAENIVTDPVAVATNGLNLSTSKAYEFIKEKLFPMSTVVTPNIPETELISGIKINTIGDMVKATRHISEKYKCAVLCKGGHNISTADDFLYMNGSKKWFYGERIKNSNTHGTGCTLSSAIACNLAKGYDLRTSIYLAKKYITSCLTAMLDIGHGNGPLNHMKGIKK